MRIDHCTSKNREFYYFFRQRFTNTERRLCHGMHNVKSEHKCVDFRIRSIAIRNVALLYNNNCLIHTNIVSVLEYTIMSGGTSSDPAVEDTVCGIWKFKPQWLQIFASKKLYVLVYGLLGLNQFMLSAYFSGTLTTIEKRFQFSSQVSGKMG